MCAICACLVVSCAIITEANMSHPSHMVVVTHYWVADQFESFLSQLQVEIDVVGAADDYCGGIC